MDEFITILNDRIREQVSPIVYIISGLFARKRCAWNKITKSV